MSNCAKLIKLINDEASRRAGPAVDGGSISWLAGYYAANDQLYGRVLEAIGDGEGLREPEEACTTATN